jgi:thiol-disulfide isomerase/thioredoxin
MLSSEDKILYTIRAFQRGSCTNCPGMTNKHSGEKMKKLIYLGCFLFVILLIGAAMFQLKSFAPAAVPQIALPVFQPNASEPKLKAVGGACPVEKCLIILVMPSCPKCRELTPTLSALAKQLTEQNIPTSIVISNDSSRAIREYAKTFTTEVLLDEQNELISTLKLPGTPYLAVLNQQGVIINDLAGFVTDARTMRGALNL